MTYLVGFLLVLVLIADQGQAHPAEDAPGRSCAGRASAPVQCIRAAHHVFDTCQMIEAEAGRHALDPSFVARVAWEQGGFGRAALSHLTDTPRSPAQAIAHLTRALAALTRQYGNPGLAALAHAGGTAQAERFAEGEGLEQRVVDFVILTTGYRPETWRDAPSMPRVQRLDPVLPFAAACVELATGRRATPLPDYVPPPDPDARSLRPRARPVPELAKWGAQFAFGNTKARARANYDRVTRACRRVLKGLRPDIIYVENRVRGRPGYYMARVSSMDRDRADEICDVARRQGCNCAVYKNW